MQRCTNKKFIRIYRRFLWGFLCLACFVFLCAMYLYYFMKTPDTIKVRAGSSEVLQLHIPAIATMNENDKSVISLMKPLTIVAGQTEESYEIECKLFGVMPLKNMNIQIIQDQMLYPLGFPIGIFVKTQGVLVIDTGDFSSAEGEECNPSVDKFMAGDYILAMNGVAVSGKKEIREKVEQSEGKEISFQIYREGEVLQTSVQPEKNEEGTYKLGVWLRDSAQGIGTITYMDSNKQFGALGHGVSDLDTGELLTLGNGLLYNTQIVSIEKGKRGTPGELTGIIAYQPENVTGVITQNTEDGIFGVVAGELTSSMELEPIPIGLKQDVERGEAFIYCCLDGTPRQYKINITSLHPNSEKKNRQISFTVVDEELIELTGGVVQGMSGCPIIQDGKFIGAVTHVLVNDPTKGYGIFIEEMLAHETE